jgi:hypothetical protein
MENVSIHIKNFNDKIKVMNQTNRKELILSAVEARNLHAEIFEILALVAKSSGSNTNENINVVMDGGGFK